MKALKAIFLYFLYLVLAVLAVIYLIFWRPYANELEQRSVPSDPLPRFDNMDFETVKKLGYVVNGKDSSFDTKVFVKPSGVIRVCALGDSFTFGDEVNSQSDYPSILQNLFLERGYTNVEVINFGNSFHGMSQTYIVWEEVARPMGCDFVLLGPQTFFHPRDRTFNHSFGSMPYYLHSIFVLDDESEGGLRRLDIKGETYQERFADYYSFFPAWRYLRYDWQPPAMINAMLPKGKEIRNPFFYLPDTEGYFLLEVWTRLLKLFSKDEAVQFVVLVMDELVYAHFDQHKVANGNLAILPYPEVSSFPNRAPNRHQSGFGNRLIAEEYFAHLTGSPQEIEKLEISARHPLRHMPACTGINNDPVDIKKVARITIESQGGSIGRLYRAANPFARTILEETNFASQNYQAMLVLVPGNDLKDAAFVMLDEVPAKDEKVYLKIGGVDHLVGEVWPLSPETGLYAVSIDGFYLDYYDTAFISSDRYPDLVKQERPDFSLWLGNIRLYDGDRARSRYSLEPVNSNQYRLVTNLDGYSIFDFREARGNLDWVIHYQADSEGIENHSTEIRCPFFSYTIHRQPIKMSGVARQRLSNPVEGLTTILYP
jgi:hypothetical protein